MKKNLLKSFVLALASLVLLSLAACGGEPVDEARFAALEAEVKALKADAQAREARFRDELTQIRKNLEGIQGLIQMDKGADALAAPKTDSAEDLDAEIDKKAKSFVSENLDRLLDITKKLLDKMEQELDKTMEQPAKPKGSEI